MTYATLNVQGSCNNLCGDAPDPSEYAARNAADLDWLHGTFDEARREHSAAVMIVWQADPGWDATDGTRAPVRDPKTLAETDGQPDGYQSLLSALRDETVAYRKPVAVRPRRLALLPHRQAVPRRQGPAPGELHARGDLRRPPGERQQRRALAQGHGRPVQPRGVLVPAADRAGQPHGGPGSVARRGSGWARARPPRPARGASGGSGSARGSGRAGASPACAPPWRPCALAIFALLAPVPNGSLTAPKYHVA